MVRYLFIVIILLSSCTNDEVNYEVPIIKELEISSVSETNVNENHASEGVMMILGNGNIIKFYRLDEGVAGGHVGNGGKIVKRISIDNGMTWGEESTVYSDQYDDRNIRGGIINDNVILLFFRRYDANSFTPIDLNYIYSLDDGVTWSEREIIDFNIDQAYEVWIDNIVDLKNGKYLLPIHGVSYCEIRDLSFEDNQIVLSEPKWIWNFTGSTDMKIDEPTFTYLGNGKILGLFRDDNQYVPGSNYFQVQSSDSGVTWSSPVRTNICEPYFSPAPLIFFDDQNQKIITIGTDRRHPNNGDYLAKDSEIWIYENSIDEVFENPVNYSLIKKINRPNPNNHMLYGYPCFTKTNLNDYLIIFTDSYVDTQNEDADLFQFRLGYK